MRKARKMTFADLVKENKRELMNNPAAMKAIEDRLAEKHERKLLSQAK
ncbi:FbpB family small basic protein [Bacillus sp. FJAT-42315]|nr:FbpB family small basic protein [Bacillus sp. FJAT-42315]OZI11844.1 FbpB family small basic protein [Bacillaceae bacterium SAS-127]PAQ15021.1 FbpB family small basic protein [Bacillaceae bacterium SAOS 7]